jgi:hypothetical protein
MFDILFDIFVEVSVTEFVKLRLVFVMAVAEASDARMKRGLDNEG